VVSVHGALNRIAPQGRPHPPVFQGKYGVLHDLYLRIERSGLFDAEAYLAQHGDLAGEDPWDHFLQYGLPEGRQFTSAESVARALAQIQSEFPVFREEFLKEATYAEQRAAELGAKLRAKNVKVGIFCSNLGNFYMHEIADLLQLGLRRWGIEAFLRHEESDKDENFEIRVVIAPHEFFFLGEGTAWQEFADKPNTVLYNVEQMQTQWFCRAFSLLLKAPLILDISPQTAQILRKAGCDAVFFMPGYLNDIHYTVSQLDISHIELMKGYGFAYQDYDWRERDALSDRPIDLLFVGAKTPHRDATLMRLDSVSQAWRFVCAYRDASKPFRRDDGSEAAAEMNWTLSQRAKIVLNLHRDWLGYFEWSRMALRGFWQGACVVTDPGLPNPVFVPGIHYLEESARHLPELIRWLLSTEDGRSKLDSTRRAGYLRATTLGSMETALAPVLSAFERLLGL